MIGLTLGLGLSPTPVRSSGGGGPTELWPQPDFASATGLTLDGGGGTTPTVSGGVLTIFDDGDPATVSATATAPLTAGSYHYSITIGSITGEISLLAGNAGPASNFSAVGTHTGDFDVPGNAGDEISLAGGFSGATISHFSFTKNS